MGSRTGLLFARGAIGTAGLCIYFYSVHALPLAAAVTIHYLSPLMTIFWSVLILKDRFPPVQLLGFLVSILGVAMIYGFDERVETLPVIISVVGAVIAGFAYNLVRLLSKTEHPFVISFSFPVVMTIVLAPIVFYDFKPPSYRAWGLLMAVGIFSWLAQLLLTEAYKRAAPSKVSQFTYSGALFSLGFGYFIFDEAYDFGALAGIALIIGGLLFTGLLQIKSSRQTRQTSS